MNAATMDDDITAVVAITMRRPLYRTQLNPKRRIFFARITAAVATVAVVCTCCVSGARHSGVLSFSREHRRNWEDAVAKAEIVASPEAADVEVVSVRTAATPPSPSAANRISSENPLDMIDAETLRSLGISEEDIASVLEDDFNFISGGSATGGVADEEEGNKKNDIDGKTAVHANENSLEKKKSGKKNEEEHLEGAEIGGEWWRNPLAQFSADEEYDEGISSDTASDEEDDDSFIRDTMEVTVEDLPFEQNLLPDDDDLDINGVPSPSVQTAVSSSSSSSLVLSKRSARSHSGRSKEIKEALRPLASAVIFLLHRAYGGIMRRPGVGRVAALVVAVQAVGILRDLGRGRDMSSSMVKNDGPRSETEEEEEEEKDDEDETIFLDEGSEALVRSESPSRGTVENFNKSGGNGKSSRPFLVPNLMGGALRNLGRYFGPRGKAGAASVISGRQGRNSQRKSARELLKDVEVWKDRTNSAESDRERIQRECDRSNSQVCLQGDIISIPPNPLFCHILVTS
uniref:Uncharacterized protein n=1 Tax=Corethron hystrix TaxID=216773 RepID=A0A6U5DBF7_9STRA|mmetsp:Transcript_11091/g.24465  ORF Transcript_11091/g.24465 Transcript_11091/m.24465 type:complete len:516 (+) Transcript_11091:208-1755(+)